MSPAQDIWVLISPHKARCTPINITTIQYKLVQIHEANMRLTTRYKIKWNPHEPCMRCIHTCEPLMGLSTPSYGLWDPHEPHVMLVACSKGSQCSHECILTFPHHCEVCNRQMRLVSASWHIHGLTTTHRILYIVYIIHIYLIYSTYPPQQTHRCLMSTPSRPVDLICQWVSQQHQPTSAGAYQPCISTCGFGVFADVGCHFAATIQTRPWYHRCPISTKMSRRNLQAPD